MSLNIKNEETHKLATLLAKETGESLTSAVTTALRERLNRIRRQRKQDRTLAELIALGKRGAALFKGPYTDPDELLYNEKGLPK